MIQLSGIENLQEAKDVLCAFEIKEHPSALAVEDIKEGLFWDEKRNCYSADFGSLLRGETDEVRIYKRKIVGDEDDWLPEDKWTPVAVLNFNENLYFFYVCE